MDKRRVDIQMAGSPNLKFNTQGNVLFRRNADNVGYETNVSQIPSLEGVASTDLYMTKGNIREPHWHPNSAEYDYVIEGELEFVIFDPVYKQLQKYHLKPRDVLFIPQGYWHWITPLTDKTHILVVFNNNEPTTVAGSDILRFTPGEVFDLAYGIPAEDYEELVSPITSTVVIGPADPETDDTLKVGTDTDNDPRSDEDTDDKDSKKCKK